MDFEKLYLGLPYGIQYLLLNAKGYLIAKRRYGRKFHQALKSFHESDRRVLDIEKLKKFMLHANKSPFWKKQFAHYQLNLESPNIVDELKKLPILSKEVVKKNIAGIKTVDLDEPIITSSTSGTTGSGLIFPKAHSMEIRQWAVWWRFRNEHGINLDDTCAWFGGRSILNIDRKKPPYWIHNRPMSQIMFSAHHLNEKTVALYFKKIKSQHIRWIHGYPSQIAYFADLVEKTGLGALNDLEIITFRAENLGQIRLR